MERHPASAGSRQELGRLLEAVLTSRGQANAVFDILAVLQVSRVGGRGGPGAASGSHDGARASPCRASRLSPRTPRKLRKECERAADSSVPCWSGKSCSWARCHAKTWSLLVSDLEGVGYSPPGSCGGTPCQHRRNTPEPGSCYRRCGLVGGGGQLTVAQEVRSVYLPGLNEFVYVAGFCFSFIRGNLLHFQSLILSLP